MKNRFLISVAAAALIAGTGFANAQGAGGGTSREGAGSTVQQSAPPAGGGAAQQAPQHRESAPPSSGMKSSQSEKAPGAAKQAEDMKGQKPAQNTATDADRAKGGKDMKAEGREGKEKGTVGQAPDKSGATTQRDEKMGHDKNAPTSAQGREDKSGTMGREDKMNAQGQKGTTEPNRAQTNPQGGAQTTTGAVTSARVAAPPPEKQTQIVSAIKSERIEETTNVNVNVSIGTVLPATVRFHPLPPRIVEIYPEWRGFEVIFIHGRYVIVRPQTREIVYIIEG
jgi:uncharacterized protein DUF1236